MLRTCLEYTAELYLQCFKNFPETFQTRSQFVSVEVDAETGNQVLSGKRNVHDMPWSL